MDALLEVADHARGEPLVHQSSIAGVERRIHIEHHEALLGDLVLANLERHRPLGGRAEAFEFPVDGDAVVILGHGPVAGAARLLLPVDRVVLAQVGEPGMGHSRDEGAGIGEVYRCDVGRGLGHCGLLLGNRTSVRLLRCYVLLPIPSMEGSGRVPVPFGMIATDLVGSSGWRMTRNLSSASGGSPGAGEVITGSMLWGWKISLRPSATPVAIAPSAERRLHASNRLGGRLILVFSVPRSVGSIFL